PRKRARKFLPSVNWRAISSDTAGLMGFIVYKVGMGSCVVKDNTAGSLTKDKRIVMPATVLEMPPMKIFSVRFYKDGKVKEDILAEGLDKELKRKVKLMGKDKKSRNIDEVKEYDDVRIIVYSQVKNTGIKKTPDLIELAVGGKVEEKLKLIKEKIGREIFASEILKDVKLVDVRGLSKGKGTAGPVKRFGIKLKSHKSEKGRRRPGTLGPWHPNRVSFRVAQAGQMGMQTRPKYNCKIIRIGKADEVVEKKEGWKNYGKIKTEYLILSGSVPGPAKRQLIVTRALRPTRKQEKKTYDFEELR
ncbi:MAG: 50S ribosomal protein L3, partial [Nanoarchaeota archaeon]